MDGCDMLDHLLPTLPNMEKQQILHTQGRIYRREYLRLRPAVPDVRKMVKAVKRRGVAVGIATGCRGDDLRATSVCAS